MCTQEGRGTTFWYAVHSKDISILTCVATIMLSTFKRALHLLRHVCTMPIDITCVKHSPITPTCFNIIRCWLSIHFNSINTRLLTEIAYFFQVKSCILLSKYYNSLPAITKIGMWSYRITFTSGHILICIVCSVVRSP